MSQVDLASLVDFNKRSFWVSVGTILWNPLFWNCVAQNGVDYISKTYVAMIDIPRLLPVGYNHLLPGNVPRRNRVSSFPCHRYHNALKEQPASDLINPAIAKPLAAVLFVVGQTFVLTSTWALGITGTFLGDYFGILMSERVTGFPFNVVENPMYVGSTMCFAATALWYSSPAGLLLTLLVHIVYSIALRYEGPFTTMIYSRAAKQSKAQ
ncbi:Phosphatidyl-N-methylethanolamine N-methyltransferase [Rhizoctonia solani]|uniref:Phosphatidyl-N-methylethanolamine N-methyltransferase n=1 Tax=Rhizoctonia solani TaxID=456999 RepID=A0A8H7H197_9AGAM|nr:Phosphatidyl-N-methylethanolamine N-methyltransferase [Rhizoctonia solani]